MIFQPEIAHTHAHTSGLWNSAFPEWRADALVALVARRSVVLHTNQIGAAGVRALAAALPAMRLRTLELGGNTLGVEGAQVPWLPGRLEGVLEP